MLIVFRSKSAGDVLMLSQHALPVLQAAGKVSGAEVPERGVFTAAQLDAAISGIEDAMRLSDEPPEHSEEDLARQPDLAHPMRQPVGFRQRAYPLLEMLRAARQHGHDVMWEPAPAW